MKHFYPEIIVAVWGFLAFVLLLLTTARARALIDRPILRAKARSVRCRKCRLSFHRASWRCGRCGAFMKPPLLYWLGRGIIEPLLSLLIVPWIVLFGLILSTAIWFTSGILPRLTPAFERLANRLGAWIAPTFANWVPQRWRLLAGGTVLLPHEVDVPIDTVIGAALTLGTCMLGSSEDEIEVCVPQPTEETLDTLRRTPGRIQEIWGYISDGHPVVPTYRDRIIEARTHGEDLIRYVEGLTAHLEKPLMEIEIRPIAREPLDSGESAVLWRFLLRREPQRKGEYPVRWEVYASPEILLRIESLLNDLNIWDSLPCHLAFG